MPLGLDGPPRGGVDLELRADVRRPLPLEPDADRFVRIAADHEDAGRHDGGVRPRAIVVGDHADADESVRQRLRDAVDRRDEDGEKRDQQRSHG